MSIINIDNLFEIMENIKYGWLDKNYKKHYNTNDNFSKYYILQSPEQVIKNKTGVCWDQVELERYYFDLNNITNKTYFICYYDNYKSPTHTFIVYIKNDKYYWFESSWEKYRGKYKYETINELLIDVKKKFIDDLNIINYNKNKLKIFEYKKPKSNINCMYFYKHCELGKKIKI